jgi:hypothetical protein
LDDWLHKTITLRKAADTEKISALRAEHDFTGNMCHARHLVILQLAYEVSEMSTIKPIKLS